VLDHVLQAMLIEAGLELKFDVATVVKRQFWAEGELDMVQKYGATCAHFRKDLRSGSLDLPAHVMSRSTPLCSMFQSCLKCNVKSGREMDPVEYGRPFYVNNQHHDYEFCDDMLCEPCYLMLATEEQVHYDQFESIYGPKLLTDGFTARGSKMSHGNAVQWKMRCEIDFPLHVLLRGFMLDVTSSAASVEIDKQRIVNSINGVPPSELDIVPADLGHQNCHSANLALRAAYAHAALQLMQTGLWLSSTLHMLTQYPERTHLTIIQMSSNTTEDLTMILTAVSQLPRLEKLTLQLDCSDAEDIGMLGLLHSLCCLQELKLGLTRWRHKWPRSLEDQFEALWVGLEARHPTLERLEHWSDDNLERAFGWSQGCVRIKTAQGDGVAWQTLKIAA